MAAGVPAITTPVGDLPEVLAGGKAGRLFPIGDAPALAQALIDVHGDPATLAALAAGARLQCAREYSHDGMVNRYLELYGLAGS
jgi:phosphatidylinositol alpha-mannosyltransferase